MSCNSKSCIGCLQSQPNQLAHMDFGGCLYAQDEESVWDTASEDSESDEDFIQDLATEIRVNQNARLEEGAQRLLEMYFGDDESEAWVEEDGAEEKEVAEKPEPEREPLFESPIPLGECPICYEELKMIDFTVTKCGHTFHSSCMFQALAQNLDCPMCRCQLLAVQEDDEEEDQGEDQDEDEDEEGSQDGEEEEEDTRPTMEQLATKLQNMGYTPVDFLTLFMEGILKRQDETRQSSEFLDDLNAKIDDIVDGNITMAHVDQRTYAQVAAKALEPQPQVQVQAV